MGYVKKALIFCYCSHNYSVGEAGAADCNNILNIDITDGGSGIAVT